MSRVAITGVGVMSPLGNQADVLFDALKRNQSGVRSMPDWSTETGLRCLLGAPVTSYDQKQIPRIARRTMSAMSEMALLASQQALAQADIADLSSTRSMICMGSTSGSSSTFIEYFSKYTQQTGPQGQFSTSFFKVMNHSVASNVAVGLNYRGPQLAVASACATGTQAIIAGWELIKSGLYDVVLAGGADELHAVSAAVFDNVHAASTQYNDRPDFSPRPFDRQRDGLVVGEGAGVLVLESAAHAEARGAMALAYVDAGYYSCDGSHMTQPQIPSMCATMNEALLRAKLNAQDIDYVNAHGTATQLGDVREAQATWQIFGDQVPVSSLKGHIGHTLAACGALETIATIEMMRHGLVIANRNLDEIDSEIPKMALLKQNLARPIKRAMVNNFAFGGINASVIVRAGEGLTR